MVAADCVSGKEGGFPLNNLHFQNPPPPLRLHGQDQLLQPAASTWSSNATAARITTLQLMHESCACNCCTNPQFAAAAPIAHAAMHSQQLQAILRLQLVQDMLPAATKMQASGA